jgi:hypothetical protein
MSREDDQISKWRLDRVKKVAPTVRPLSCILPLVSKSILTTVAEGFTDAFRDYPGTE